MNSTGDKKRGDGNPPMTQTRAASLLNVSRGHLNMVLRGHRQSRSLQAKWEALQMEEAKRMSEQSNPRFSQDRAPGAAGAPLAVDPAFDPAGANWCSEWLDTFAKVGLTVVMLEAPYSAALWQNARFEEKLGEELDAAHLGLFDSAKFGNPICFFFHLRTRSLAAGLNFIKGRLALIGLLPHIRIRVVDPEAKVWRLFYPEAEKAGT